MQVHVQVLVCYKFFQVLNHTYASSCFAIQVQLRSEVLATQRKQLQEFANSVYDQLPSELRSSVELACEKGAST